jgi:hypothetical protein
MSEITEAPEQAPEKSAEPEKGEHGELPRARREQFHPHRHGHVAIQPPETGVTHLDPGVVTFS